MRRRDGANGVSLHFFAPVCTAAGMAAEAPPFGDLVSNALVALADGQLTAALAALRGMQAHVGEQRKLRRLQAARRQSEGSQGALGANEEVCAAGAVPGGWPAPVLSLQVLAAVVDKLQTAVRARQDSVNTEDSAAVKEVWRVGAQLGDESTCAWFAAHVVCQFESSATAIQA